MPLSGKQRSHLRGLGHHLDPVLQVGKEGLSEGLVAAARIAIHDHELIKIRLGEGAGGETGALARELAGQLGAEVAGALGRTALLYKRHPAKPRIALPDQKSSKRTGGASPRAKRR
jgi:RNA-binding protein